MSPKSMVIAFLLIATLLEFVIAIYTIPQQEKLGGFRILTRGLPGLMRIHGAKLVLEYLQI